MELDGAELRKIEARMQARIRERKAGVMTNLKGLPLNSVETRLQQLVKERIEETKSSEAAALLDVVRTEEGRTLWEKARQMRRAKDEEDTPGAVAFSNTAASLIVEEAQLENIITLQMSETGQSRENAERAVIHTDKGLRLWEKCRGLRLAESR